MKCSICKQFFLYNSKDNVCDECRVNAKQQLEEMVKQYMAKHDVERITCEVKRHHNAVYTSKYVKRTQTASEFINPKEKSLAEKCKKIRKMK